MKNLSGRYILLMLHVCLLQACIEPYTPKEILDNGDFLVVDGFLNVGSDSSFIYLSRTRRLSDEGARFFVSGAEVTAVGEDGMEYPFQERENGTYFSNLKSLNRDKKYKTTIKLRDGKIYESEFVEVKVSPEIENVNYEIGSDGVKILVNTYDPDGNSKYYMWNYTDTWTFNVAYESFYEYAFGILRSRTDQIYTCWNSEKRSPFVIGTSENLSEDRISNSLISIIPSSSVKLSKRFSRLIKQTILTEEGFKYWQNVYKMNETMGSIFDPMPGEVLGNIKNVNNPTEQVVGFISAGTISEKRVYINKSELPWYYNGEKVLTNTENCPKDTIFTNDPYLDEVMYNIFNSGLKIPLNKDVNNGVSIYLYADQRCADCRMYGTNVKPEYWLDR